jgi:hypothetical protein
LDRNIDRASGAPLSVITVDANGDAIVTSDNAVPTTRTSAVASLPMTMKLFDGWSVVSIARGANI